MSEFFEFHVNRQQDKNEASYFDKQINSHRNNKPDQKCSLNALKKLIESTTNLALKDKSCCSDDNFLNRFLNAKKLDSGEAFQLLINYMLYKDKNKSILQNINIFDENIKKALRDGNPSVLKDRDRKGRKILTFSATYWDPNKYSLVDVYRAFLFSIDKLLEDQSNQALGLIVVVDWSNFSKHQSTYLSPRFLKIMIEGLQDCMPVKFKGIHFIAQPWYLDVAFRIVKPFFKEKTKKHLIIHGSNLSSLHNFISKDVLPPELGGEGYLLNTLDWYHDLLDSSQTTENQKSYRLITIPQNFIPKNT